MDCTETSYHALSSKRGRERKSLKGKAWVGGLKYSSFS